MPACHTMTLTPTLNSATPYWDSQPQRMVLSLRGFVGSGNIIWTNYRRRKTKPVLRVQRDRCGHLMASWCFCLESGEDKTNCRLDWWSYSAVYWPVIAAREVQFIIFTLHNKKLWSYSIFFCIKLSMSYTGWHSFIPTNMGTVVYFDSTPRTLLQCRKYLQLHQMWSNPLRKTVPNTLFTPVWVTFAKTYCAQPIQKKKSMFVICF